MHGSGTLYVDKVVRGTWRVLIVTYKDGKAHRSTVSKLAYSELGFRPDMTIEQARARAKAINAQGSIERKSVASVTKTAKRVEQDALSHSVFVPQEINDRFLAWMDENIVNKKRSSYWAVVKKLVITLQLSPYDYFDNKKKIYRYFASLEYSPDYVKKLLRIMNAYGRFMCRYVGKYYEKVPNPRGHDREMINDAYLDSDSYFGPSDALTPAALSQLAGLLKPEQHSWLALSVWFGLRPSEIDLVLSDRDRKFWRVEHGDVEVLWVYQSKLTSKPRDERWKPIPIILPEQLDAIKIIYSGNAAKPLTKTIKRLLNRQTTLYGGRKGFVDLMLNRGQQLEDIAQWLGHSSIEMTWTRYKDKKRVGFSKVT